MLSTLGSIASQGGGLPLNTLIYSRFDGNLLNDITGTSWGTPTNANRGEYSFVTDGAKFNQGFKHKLLEGSGHNSQTSTYTMPVMLPDINSNFTIQFWFKRYPITQTDRTSFEIRYGLNRLFIIESTKTNSFYLCDKLVNGSIVFTPNISFFRIIKNGNTISVYQDGVLKGSTTWSFTTKYAETISLTFGDIYSQDHPYTITDDFLFTTEVLNGSEVPTSPYL